MSPFHFRTKLPFSFSLEYKHRETGKKIRIRLRNILKYISVGKFYKNSAFIIL